MRSPEAQAEVDQDGGGESGGLPSRLGGSLTLAQLQAMDA